MSDARAERLEDLFHRAAALPAGERPALVQAECAEDAALATELLALLRQLDRPTPDGLEPRRVRPAEATEPTRIGRYRILERIGEGGMGVVYRAEQTEPVQRIVALKVVRAGMDTEQAMARFALERQALAQMDHPHIARIHDAGATEAGRPYYVMEYTPGANLVAFCDRRRLGVDARLRLFLAVCSAVQHAHQRGIIHRDLKPSNVLVSEVSGAPMVKVIDFGIARPAAGEAAAHALPTRAGDVVGTFDYMSPEQALGGVDVDTRTDIHALGVMLYELLTGVLPFAKARLHRLPLAQVQQFLAHAEPPRPSTEVTRAGASDAAAVRASEPGQLRRRLRGDLDWIVLKAMARERAQRYASASELAADLQRHLACEPVLAGPPSARYRLGKFVRRHRGAVLAAAAVLLAIGAGFVATWLAMQQARAAEAREVVRAEALRRQLYANQVTLAQQAIERGEAVVARQLLEAGPTDLRGLEWRYLQAIADQSLCTTKFAPDDHGATAAVLHADGRRLLVGCGSGGLAVVDPGRGAIEARQPLSDSPIVDVVADAARQQLLVGNEAGTWWLLDAATLQPRRTVATALDGVRRAALAPDGRRIALLRGESAVQLLDLDSGASTACERPARAVELQRIRFHPDGRHVVAAGVDLLVWDADGALRHDLPEPRRHWRSEEHPNLQPRITALAFAADGQQLAIGIGHAETPTSGVGNRIELRRTSDYGLEQLVPMPGRGVLPALAFAPDGLSLAAASGTELLLTGRGGSWRQQRIAGAPSPVKGIVHRTDGSFVSFGAEGVQLWPPQPVPTPDSIELALPWGRMVWSADRRLLAVPAWSLGGSVVYDTTSFELVRAFLPPHGPNRVHAFWPDGEHVLAAGSGGAVGIHRLADGALVQSLPTGAVLVQALVSADGERCLGADAEGGLHAFARADGSRRTIAAPPSPPAPVQALLASADGWVVVREGGAVELRHQTDFRLVAAWSLPGPVRAAAVAAAARRLYAVGGDGALWGCALAAEPAVERLGAVGGSHASIDVSDDGERLVLLDGDRPQLRDARDGRVLLPQLPGGQTAASVVFAGAGTGVLGAGQQLVAWQFGLGAEQLAQRAAAVRGSDAFRRLKGNHATIAAMRAEISAEPLDAAARAVLLRRLDRFGDSPFDLNHEAWYRVLRPYLAPADYRFAVLAAESAVASMPLAGFRNTLGTAYLRAGEHARAIAVAGALVSEAVARGEAPDPIDLAVLTMAHARLGDDAQAQQHWRQLQALVAEPANVKDPQAWIFVREAATTMAGK
ncbi:MAG: serine/threonine-protein kinase [Planctomycetes bacterium]|nr:serine/threonine-protein kinase [Planctomycetota bacterium]